MTESTESKRNIETMAIDLEHWRERALLAERASEQKEAMLHAITDAASKEGRTIVAVVLQAGSQDVGMSFHSGQPWEAETADRWAKVIARFLHTLDITIKQSALDERRRELGEVVDDELDEE